MLQLIDLESYAPAATGLVMLLGVALIAHFIVKSLVKRILSALVRANRPAWDADFSARNVYGRLAHAAPALIIFASIGLVPDVDALFAGWVRNLALTYLVVMVTLCLSALLSAAGDLYERDPVARTRPIRGVLQLLQLIAFLVALILIISVLTDQSPLLLLSGLGAMTAVILLIFRDTILGFVASLQINAHDLIHVGDWIEMPQVGVDGDVLEVGLHTVKVRNFDRTIVTVPTHKLMSESFKNWRGMAESGTRRIKRAILVDQASVRFLTAAEVDYFRNFDRIRDYVTAKIRELGGQSGAAAVTPEVAAPHPQSAVPSMAGATVTAEALHGNPETVNARRLTNIGTFRAYLLEYLRAHPAISRDATLLVRQLQPGPHGLPLELYCFTNTAEWAAYEDIQSDIFDHVIAVAPQFGLRLYQAPGSSDVRSLAPVLKPV